VDQDSDYTIQIEIKNKYYLQTVQERWTSQQKPRKKKKKKWDFAFD
jgi:hypothetical protein